MKLAEGRARAQWETTALICALIFNAHSSKTQKTPNDFNPFAEQKKTVLPFSALVKQ